MSYFRRRLHKNVFAWKRKLFSPFGLPFTLKRWKHMMKMQTIESGDQSGNFENGDSKNTV